MPTRTLTTLFATLLFSSWNAQAQTVVDWSNASAGGNGCPTGTSVVTITPGGEEIAWTFDAFGFNLTRGPESANLFCRLSASARVKKGLYLAEIKQELTYGGSKSKDNSYLSVGALSRFFGRDLPAINKVYNDGVEFDSVFENASSSIQILLPDGVGSSDFCGADAPVGLFQATLSAVGRTSPRGFASLAVQGQNVTFKAITNFVECPQN